MHCTYKRICSTVVKLFACEPLSWKSVPSTCCRHTWEELGCGGQAMDPYRQSADSFPSFPAKSQAQGGGGALDNVTPEVGPERSLDEGCEKVGLSLRKFLGAIACNEHHTQTGCEDSHASTWVWVLSGGMWVACSYAR